MIPNESLDGPVFLVPLGFDCLTALEALSLYYNNAQKIIFGLDSNRVDWNGKPFAFQDDLFSERLSGLDHNHKVTLVEGDFHSLPVPALNREQEQNVLLSYVDCAGPILWIESDQISMLNTSEDSSETIFPFDFGLLFHGPALAEQR